MKKVGYTFMPIFTRCNRNNVSPAKGFELINSSNSVGTVFHVPNAKINIRGQ